MTINKQICFVIIPLSLPLFRKKNGLLIITKPYPTPEQRLTPSKGIASEDCHQPSRGSNKPQEAAISYRHFSFKRVSDCQNADAQGVCGLFVTGRECSRLTGDY